MGRGKVLLNGFGQFALRGDQDHRWPNKILALPSRGRPFLGFINLVDVLQPPTSLRITCIRITYISSRFRSAILVLLRTISVLKRMIVSILLRILLRWQTTLIYSHLKRPPLPMSRTRATPCTRRYNQVDVKFTVSIYRDEDGIFIAECSSILGCTSQGQTEAEAETNIADAFRECPSIRAELGMPLTRTTREIEVTV